MLRKLLFILVTALFCTQAKAYLDPFQPSINRGYGFYNPAYFVPNSQFTGSVNYMNLWTQLIDNPQTFIVQGDANLFNNKLRGGGYFFREKALAAIDFNFFAIHASYQWTMAKDIVLSFGARVNYVQLQVDFDKFTFPGSGGPQSRPSGKKSYYQPDFDAGLWLSAKKFYGGISIRHFTQPEFNVETSGIGLTEMAIFQPTVYTMAGYEFTIGQNLSIEPTFRYQKTVSTKYANFDLPSIATMVGWSQKVYVGVNVRPQNNAYPIDLLARFQASDNLRFAGSYSPASEKGITVSSFEVGMSLVL